MQQRQRYYFVIPAVTDIGRLIGLLITAQFVAFVLLTHSIILGAVIAPIAVLGIYLMFRRPTADFFAEIGPSALTIRMVFNYRISYWSIESVGLFRNESGRLMDLANRMADKWSRLFGSQGYDLVPIGETNPRRVEIRLRKPMLLLLPFPPFVWRKKVWHLLPMSQGDAGAVVSHVNRRMEERGA